MDGAAKDELRESIRKGGVREPIVLLEGKILDGRNRYLVAEEIGIDDIPTRNFDPDKEGNPLDFVWDANVNRRHLNETQLGLVAAEMETFRHGGSRKPQELHTALEFKPQTRVETAKRYGIGRDTIYKMAVVRDKGVPELKEAVRRGDVNARTAKAIAEQPVNVQQSIISHASAITGCDRPRAFRVEATKALQRAKMAETAKANRALDTRGKTYDVIYADPPWQFDSELTGSSRAVENHYATMPTAEISKLPVGALAAKNAILFLWTTDHHLLEAEQVVEAWGFTRRARMVWVKNSIGLAGC